MFNNLGYNRIMIAATGSGVGKTTVTIGLLATLKSAGLKVHSFKSGPDYIDPMYHRSVIGVPSKNLDPFFCDEQLLTASFLDSAYGGNDAINIIEGAMGLYDGIGASQVASSYDVAKALNCPIILVCNAKAVGYSIIPVIKGFLSEDVHHNIKAVILNQMSESYYSKIAPVIEEQCHIKVLGFIPSDKNMQFESRHLGLKAPEENSVDERLTICQKAVEKSIDIQGIIDIARTARSIKSVRSLKDYIAEPITDKHPVIAVARDEAFSFYYEDNIKALELCGAKIMYFSPLSDNHLPDNTRGIFFPGGYPELYVKKLQANEALIIEIKNVISSGMPVLAECGGFMYLHYIGVLNGEVTNTGKSVRFGYIDISNDKYHLKGHEFHHYDVTNPGSDYLITPANGRPVYRAMVEEGNIIAGFPHLYYFSDIEFVKDYVRKILDYDNR